MDVRGRYLLRPNMIESHLKDSILDELKEENVKCINQAWENYNCNNYSFLSQLEESLEVSDKVVDKILSGKVQQFYYYDSEWCDHFSSDQVVNVRKLFDLILDNDFIGNFCDDVLNKNKAVIPSPFGDSLAECAQSIYASNRTFLRFIDGENTFYIVQHHKFARALYFPVKNIVVCVDKIELPVSVVNVMNKVTLKNLITYSNNSVCQPKARFGGVFVSYPRPYHYFYDTLPSFLSEKLPLGSEHKIFSIKSGGFFPVADLVDGGCEELSFDTDDSFNRYLVNNNLFHIQVGYTKSRLADFYRFDELIIEKSKSRYCEVDGDLLVTLKKHDFLVWFGVCSEKREWKEQIEGISKIIIQLSEQYKSLGVVFDGITTPMKEGQEWVRKSYAHSELSILAQIVERIPSSVKVYDLIGAFSYQKIAFASHCNMFLSSYLTDSMYMARFAKKVGLAHGANLAMYSDHYHPHTYFVPKMLVKDFSEQGQNWSTVSYSINPVNVSYILDTIASNSACKINRSYFVPKQVKGLSYSKEERVDVFDLCAVNSPMYISLGGENINFEKSGPDSTNIDDNSLYHFYFRGRKIAGVACSLHVIANDGARRVFSESIQLSSDKCVEFPEGAKSFRFFLRFMGDGRVEINDIEYVVYKKSRLVLGTDSDSKKQSELVIDSERSSSQLEEGENKLYGDSINIINDCKLYDKNGCFCSEISLIQGEKLNRYKYAWYLYRDGVRVEQIAYDESNEVLFSTPVEKGVYWVMGFVRGDHARNTMKSKKYFGD